MKNLEKTIITILFVLIAITSSLLTHELLQKREDQRQLEINNRLDEIIIYMRCEK